MSRIFGLALALAFASAVVGAQTPLVLPQFEEATDAAGIDFGLRASIPLPGLGATDQVRYGAGAAAGDYDLDGDLDLYLVAHFGDPNRLYRNEGDGTFTDVTAQAGVGDLGWGHMALWLDLDGDGDDDLFVANDSTTGGVFPFSRIYENLGDGTFSLVDNTGITPWIQVFGGATAGDYDLDGDIDLYLTSWWDGFNYLYRNDGDFTFTDVTFTAGLQILETLVPHFAPLFVDVNEDGWPDLFGAVDFQADYLFLNNQDGTFSFVSQDYSFGNDMGLAPGDFDQDGDIDFYTTNITDGDPNPCCNWLYQNDGTGQFTNVAGPLGLRDTDWGWGTVFGDYDLDGDLDLAVVNGWIQPVWVRASQLFVNFGGRFRNLATECGFAHVADSRGLLSFDYDDDGDLDLLVSDVLERAVLYENTTPRGDRHWITIRLRGTDSNTNGIGARVTVKAGGQAWHHEITAGGSFYTGLPLEAHFGLGTADLVDRITVRWPSGRVQVLDAVDVDRRLVLFEGNSSR